MNEITELTASIAKFAADRNWEQFHTPKNLIMALSVEVAEIMEHLQWLTPEQSLHLSQLKRAEVEEEIGDVFIYLLRICDVLDIDPVRAAKEKLVKNAGKYPVEKAKDNARKYNEL